jgi:hypothetical protein
MPLAILRSCCLREQSGGFLHSPTFPACKVLASCPTLYVEANIWMNLVV